MRCRLFLLMLALAAGSASAPAQESMRAGNPKPVQAQPAKPAIKHHPAHNRIAHGTATATTAAKSSPAQQRTHRAKPTQAEAVKPAVQHHAAHRHIARHKTKPIPAAKVPLPQPAPREVMAKAAPVLAAVPLPTPSPARANAKPAKAAPTFASIPKVPLPASPPPRAGAQAEKAAPAAAAGVPPDERRKIQSALLWSGDYADTPKGEDPLVAAIKNFQKRHKAPVTGELTSAQRDALLAAAAAHERRFGWSVVIDPATGIRLGLPSKLVPHAHDVAHGTRWSSPHGEVQVETFRLKQLGLKLADLYEREKREPRTRRVERSNLHDDSFVIGGMQGLKYFSVHAAMRDGEVRGVTVLYDQAMEGIVEPLVPAMASAFSPFPEHAVPFAALAKSVEYGTGLIVSGDGHILATRKVADGCQVIVVPGLGNAERVAEDKANGLALLRVYGQRKLSALSFAAAAPKAAELTLIGIPDPREQNGRKSLTEIKARLAGSAIELRRPVPVAGFSGAAALDAQGHVLGMMATRNAVLASTAPSAPPVWLVGAGTIRDFLQAQHVPQATAPSEARDAVVRVICVRK